MPIIVNLDVMMARRKMSLNELASRVDLTLANLSVLKNNHAKAVRFSTLEAICRALNCQPGDILEYVVSDGGGRNGQVAGYRIGGKTGSSQTGEADHTIVSFVGFAPADDPQIAIAVMMEYGNKGPYAQNVAKDILDQYFGFYTWDEEGNRYDSEGNLVDDEGKVLKTKEQLAEEKARQEEKEKDKFLSSALENGDSPMGESSVGAGDGETSSQKPEDPENSGRGDIPTTPFTGETSSSPVSSAPETESLPRLAEALPPEERTKRSRYRLITAADNGPSRK